MLNTENHAYSRMNTINMDEFPLFWSKEFWSKLNSIKIISIRIKFGSNFFFIKIVLISYYMRYLFSKCSRPHLFTWGVLFCWLKQCWNILIKNNSMQIIFIKKIDIFLYRIFVLRVQWDLVFPLKERSSLYSNRDELSEIIIRIEIHGTPPSFTSMA